MIVVDSSVWIALLRKSDTEAVRRLRAVGRPRDILLGDLVLHEVLRGARDDAHASRLEADLRQFKTVAILDAEVAILAADHYRYLRSKGITLRGFADLLIATFCVHQGYALLQQDRDFRAMVRYFGLELA